VGVKVGLVGAGTMGRRHLQALREDPRAEIVGVADVVPEAARTAAAEVGAQSCRTLADLAALGIEAVFVTLPNVHHNPMVLEALDRGLHVFSEKPMATTLDAGREIWRRARSSHRVYQMGFNRRWAPAYQFLRRHVDRGFTPYSANVKINDGDMLTPSWYTNVAVSGGFMYDTAVHLFEMVA
jgi:myo-inositol 2-dehydrogenase / D-chiro-inositol 1-dehydrogenase